MDPDDKWQQVEASMREETVWHERPKAMRKRVPGQLYRGTCGAWFQHRTGHYILPVCPKCQDRYRLGTV